MIKIINGILSLFGRSVNVRNTDMAVKLKLSKSEKIKAEESKRTDIPQLIIHKTTEKNRSDKNMKYHCYRNRELSALEFNKRVLEEADDKTNPLCERMLFTSIYKSNMDEFFMVRVGMLHDRMLFSDNPRENKTNMTAEEQIDAIIKRSRELDAVCGRVYKDIMTDTEKLGIKLVNFDSITKKQSAEMKKYFKEEIKPLLSPQVVGRRQPFPFLKNKDIYVLVSVETKSGKEKIGIIPCSNGVFRRLIPVNGVNGVYMLAEDLIRHYAADVFDNYKIKEKAVMRIIRNADMDTDEVYDDEAAYRDMMELMVKKRKKLSPVRLDLSAEINKDTINYLCNMLELPTDRVFFSDIPLELSFFTEIQELLHDRKELFFDKRIPQQSAMVDKHEPMIDQIRRNDIILAYPFESMNPYLRLLREAAEDDEVVSIKMTLYRVAKYSKIVEALIEAAENGKEVVVLVELRARFDEENNIEWSKRLEEAGCRVIYGLNRLKVHSKLCLITRRTKTHIEYITQIGTGNYNEKTSKLYTDFSLMTASPEIGAEASNVLNELAMGQVVEETRHLLVAPKCLQNKLLAMIDEEIVKAKSGKPAYIGAKINSLTDKAIIDRLIEASQAGVKIELIVRGICCLIPGIEGETENIIVISIVGRFLEHSRIYIFGAEPDSKVYISSADYMTRNTLHRVEVAVPLYDPKIKERVLDMFNIMMNDNVKARYQIPSGGYIKLKADDVEPLNSQEYFYEEAYSREAHSHE